MAKINLSRMDVQALIDLRKQVEGTLVSQRSTLEKQLAALGGSIASLGGKLRAVAVEGVRSNSSWTTFSATGIMLQELG